MRKLLSAIAVLAFAAAVSAGGWRAAAAQQGPAATGGKPPATSTIVPLKVKRPPGFRGEIQQELDDAEQKLAGILLPAVKSGRFDPPWIRDLAAAHGLPEERVRQLMRKLARQGEVFQVVRDLFYHREAIRELATIAALEARKNDGKLAAAPFRDVTALGRKRAIQVLEFFDRVGYTRFHRDLHVMRTDSRWLDLP